MALSRSVLATRRQPLGNVRKPSLLEEVDCLYGSGEFREVGFVLLTLGSRWRNRAGRAVGRPCVSRMPEEEWQTALSLWTRCAPVSGGAGEAVWPRESRSVPFLVQSAQTCKSVFLASSSDARRPAHTGLCECRVPSVVGLWGRPALTLLLTPTGDPGGFTSHTGLSSVVRSVIL